MAPPISTFEAWKHVTQNGTHIKWGPGGGVQACKGVTRELKAILEKELVASMVGKVKKVQKKQRIEEDISRFTYIMSSSSMQSNPVRVSKESGKLFNNFCKPVLANTGGPGGGVQECKGATPELKAILEKELVASMAGKVKKAQKKQRIQKDISRVTYIMSSSSMQSNPVRVSKESGTLFNKFWKPVEKQEVDDAVADLFYTSSIPFNVARSPHFPNTVHKIVELGKGYTPRGSEAIKTTLLQSSKGRVTEKLVDVKATWKETGCTKFSDGWSDMCQSPLINVLASCLDAIVFLKVIDTMNHKKTSKYIFQILEEAILEVGVENVVQVVTDNTSNCVGVVGG
ncbi:hypothetical protein SUGI_0864810 [Cryptomeria japonica]|nr:hypothetical protein SUGI_0864810 [Cryptomeria japonica]